MFDLRKVAPNCFHRVEVIGVDADNPRSTVIDDVGEVVRRQSVVERNQDSPNLGDGVERLELGMRVGRDVRHPVTLPHTEPMKGRGPTVAAVEELLVGQAEVAVDDRLTLRVEAPGAPEKL